MTIEQEAIIEWYQNEYNATLKNVKMECSEDWFWNQKTAEEQMIRRLLYMTQLRNMIEGLKKASK